MEVRPHTGINVSMYLPRAKNTCRYIIMSYLREDNEQKFTKSVTIHHGQTQTKHYGNAKKALDDSKYIPDEQNN